MISEGLILPTVVLSAVILSQPVGHSRKVFITKVYRSDKVVYHCDASIRGFESRLHKVVFRVILVPQNNK